MAQKKSEAELVICPVGRFFLDFQKVLGGDSQFGEHLNKSRLEFLRAVRALVDERIEHIEKKGAAAKKKRMTKVKVE